MWQFFPLVMPMFAYHCDCRGKLSVDIINDLVRTVFIFALCCAVHFDSRHIGCYLLSYLFTDLPRKLF